MALKKKERTTPINNVGEEREARIERLRKELDNLYKEGQKIDQQKVDVRNQIAALRILPFKSGDTVLCSITSGRRREEKKCVIEIEDGCVYVRPFKNGTEELSGRHFSVSVIGNDYSIVFKKVE